jgi:hypothetical protein
MTMSVEAPQPTDTIYSVGIDRRSRVLLADVISSRTVAISSSTVSGVNEDSPSFGHTQAYTLSTRTETPSSRYSNVAGRHSFEAWCSPQTGTGWLVIAITSSFLAVASAVDFPTLFHREYRRLQTQRRKDPHIHKLDVNKLLLSETTSPFHIIALFCHRGNLR